ncbi:hypothetical protein SETIT_1G357700v2 [Setaria italica]|uniref:Uncharacterized protein n=1 Tax=Setaria italica TaxID=4555 RepID=A0A368PT56_SETIT|nr:hypothetical protein SETIT_1G357700v2 [Setaria italica]
MLRLPPLLLAAGGAHDCEAAQGPGQLAGAARTRTPSATNYDIHSPTWGDGRPAHPPSAMWATDLGHGPS